MSPASAFLSRSSATLALLLALAASAGAAPSEDYFCRVWRVEDGLTDNSVNAAVQDSQGYIWLATLVGLARFDGREFKEFQLPSFAEAGENIRALAREGPDTLVMLPASGGVVRLREGHFSRHPADAAVRGRTLRQLYVSSDGALWLGEMRGEILRWKDGSLEVFGSKDGVPAVPGGFSLADDGSGRTWVAEGGYLGWFANGRLTPYPEKVGSDLAIASARGGGLWISTARQLLRLRGGHLTVEASVPAWSSIQDSFRCLYEDNHGVLWVGTHRRGLLRYADGKLQPVATQQQVISALTEDSEQGIWVASKGGGVARLQRKRFVLVRPREDQTDAASTAVTEDAAGVIWCANRNGGIFRYQDGRIEPVPNPASDPQLYANTICADRNGGVWVGAGSGLYRIEPGEPGVLRPSGPRLPEVHILYQSRDGDLWISSDLNRLVRFHQGRFQELTLRDGFPGRQVEGIAETSDGTLWFAIDGALYSSRGGRLVRDPAYAPPFPPAHIEALHADADGGLWIGTEKGLLWLRRGRLSLFTQANGLPSDRIEQIEEDGHRMLWLNSRQGLFLVSRAKLEAAAGRPGSRVAAITFGAGEGLASQIPVINCQPDTWRGPDGRLWFCTQQGVIGIDAKAVPLDLPPPPLYLDQVRVDGRGVDPSALRLSGALRRLSLVFSSPSFAAPEKVRLRYRIAGFDRGWNETVSGQEVGYADLPAGRYLLEAEASDPNGLWHGSPGLRLPLVVVPLWWETWWARALSLGLFAGVIAWLARFLSTRLLKRRLRQIEREHALEKERARIARDLHDELGGSLTQIGLLADRLRRRTSQPELAGGLGQLTRQTQRLAGDLESIIWTVNPRNNSLDQLGSFIRRFALRFFQDTPITCSILGAEELPSLAVTPEAQHHLLTATKEALNNVLKHSQAQAVRIDLRYAAGWFSTVISDDGVGFDTQAASHSERNGLGNLRSRVSEIGGIIAIVSAPGRGTQVSWKVPIAAVPACAPVSSPP